MSNGASSSGSLSRQTIVVSLLSVGSVVSSLLGSIVVAYLYGASNERDAYLVASTIPMYIASVFAGNLSLLFLPVLIDHQVKDPDRAWSLASSVVTLTLVGLSVVGGLVCLFAVPLADWLLPSDRDLALTAKLLRLLTPSAVFNSLASLFSSLLYSEHRFVLPTIAPILGALLAVLFNLLLHPALGVVSLALGTTIGAIFTSGVLAVPLIRRSRIRWSLDVRDERLARLARSSIPLIASSLLYRFNSGFERLIGAQLPTGSISFVNYAATMMTVLASVTSAGVTTTVFPLIARAWSTADRDTARRLVGVAIRSILLVVLPTAAFMAVFGRDIIALLLQRGAFDAAATDAVNDCVRALLVGYLASSLGNVAARCFYVTNKTTFLSVYTVFETAAYVATAYLLSRVASYAGLAAATSVRDSVSVIIYFAIVSRIFDGLGFRSVAKDAARIAAAAAVFFLLALAVRACLQGVLPVVLVIPMAAMVASAGYLYLTIFHFKVEETRQLLGLVRARLRNLIQIPSTADASQREKP